MASDKEFTADEVGAFSDAMRERMRPENYVPSHTHRSMHDIEKALDVGRFGLFLMWVAKADKYALSICTDSSKNNVMGLGKLVVFTTLLAFFTSWYTITSMLLPHAPVFTYLLGPVLAMVYSFGIFLIDREIVSAVKTNLVSNGARVLFAIAISMTVAYPIKLLLLQDAIRDEIDLMIKERFSEEITRRDALKKELDAVRERMEKAFSKSNKLIEEEAAGYQEEADKERRNNVKCGVICEGYLKKKHNAEAKLAAQKLLQEAQIQNETKTLQERIGTATKSYDAAMANRPHDLLTKWEASHRLANRVEGAEFLQNFLIVFFLCVELIPLVMKWSLGKSEYSYYLDARNTINIQKIISITNYYMGAMQTGDPDVLKKIPAEVSDIIQYMMEDESNRPEADKQSRQSAPSSVSPSPGHTPVRPGAPETAAAAAAQNTAGTMDETVDEPPVRG